MKYADDKHDAFWLAELLRLNILPEGYIYPKETRPLRDLLRKRSHLVRLRTSLVVSLISSVTRNHGCKISSNAVKRVSDNCISRYLTDTEELSLIRDIGKEAIDSLTEKINRVESAVMKKVKLRKEYKELLTIPGVGFILASTIALETGPIGRFAKAGNYVSYCRKVSSQWTSNEKVKGKGNKKNGNKYLAWAFSEAAEYARRYSETCGRFYNRKLSKQNKMVAHNALAHKLARAAYYIMKDNVSFNETKLFA